jgi:hypothetical protein
MTLSQYVEPLREGDAFQKNVFLMFNDIEAAIREKTLAVTLTDRLRPESSCGVWTSKNSEHKHLYIFESGGALRFVQILVKAQDDLLRSYGSQYKAVCKARNRPCRPATPHLWSFSATGRSALYRGRKSMAAQKMGQQHSAA